MTFTDRKTLRLAAFAGALLATLATATVARAAEASKEPSKETPRTMSTMMKMEPIDAMHAMDKGGKGYVTKEEFMKFYEQVFQQMDKDKNGKLSEPEFTDKG